MFKRKLLFILALSLISFAYAFAQDEDTTGSDNEWWGHHHRFRFHWFDEGFSRSRPTLSFNYGLSNTALRNFNESFANPGLAELKLGYTYLKNDFVDENILDYNFKYFYLSNFSTDLSGGNINTGELKADLWRFGFGRSSGYGYDLGSAAIIPYYSYSVDWSRLRMIDLPSTAADLNTTNLFNESFRFGTSTEGGVRFKVLQHFILEAGYERSIIFPRHLFWKWAGSAVIEAAGQWGIDGFVDQILDSSPYAAPIVSFVLKNALSYGIYELRQDKMNWPFETAAPLSFDQFKFGVTFVF